MATMTFNECKIGSYAIRTVENVKRSDCTIAFAVNFKSAGEILTFNSCNKYNKPYIAIDLNNKEISPERIHSIRDTLLAKLEAVGHNHQLSGISIHIAGNGIYSLLPEHTQLSIDLVIENYMNALADALLRSNVVIHTIYSGGQTGIDEAGIKWSITSDIDVDVLAPKGWKFRDEKGIDWSNEEKFKQRFHQAFVALSK